MKFGIASSRPLLALALTAVFASFASAQHPVAPGLSSNPGARYNIFLNFSGFDYEGTWGGGTPGNVQAYTQDEDASTFNPDEIGAIKETWARVSQAFVGFNINVTTVDPAPSNLNDAQRKAFYDNKQYMTHTIIGGGYDWFGPAGGVSYVGVAQQGTTAFGMRTNWVFPVNGTGTTPKYMTAAIIHEDGHHLSLNHQSDEANGDGYSSNNGASGDGSYAPIMGVAYYSQRGTWRAGTNGLNANDVLDLQNNLDIGSLIDSGIGHSIGTATDLAVTSEGAVVSADAQGWIMPLESTGYSPDSYTKDYFKFNSGGGQLSLTAHDGTQFLQSGVADPGATMRSVLRILDANGNVLGVATEDSTTLVHNWTGLLSAGTYFAEVSSYGAYVSSYEGGSRYFNMGAYFLSGTGFAPVPEPATMLVIASGVGLVLRRRRSK